MADGDRDQIRLSGIDFAKLLEKKKPEGLEVQYRYFKNEDHDSVIHRSFYNNIEKLFSGWRLKSEQIESMSSEQIKVYYRNLSNKTGYKRVPSWALLEKARQLTIAGEKAKALEIYEFILDQNPNYQRLIV